MKLKRLVALLGLLGATASAHAGIQVWNFQDDSIEFILREVGGVLTPITSGTAQPDDIFVSVFEFFSASAAPGGSLIPAGQELTGVAVMQLDTLTTLGTIPVFGFKPYSGGMNAILNLIGPGAPNVVGGNAGGGAMAAMWLNNVGPSAHSFIGDRNLILDAADATYGNTTNCTSLVDCLTQASLGTLFQVDGMWGVDTSDRKDPDNFWAGIGLPGGTTSYGVIHAGAPTTQFLSFSAGLSNLFNVVTPVLFQHISSGDPCGGFTADNCVQVRVSGQVLGGKGLVNGAVARNDLDARKLVMVPEPATLGLLGLGLLGLGLLRRRMA